jgi:hypothetical protein
MSNVVMLPIWKENVTVAERFRELATWAELHPERFERVVIGWHGLDVDGEITINYIPYNCNTMESLGLLRMIEWKIEGHTRHDPL